MLKKEKVIEKLWAKFWLQILAEFRGISPFKMMEK